MSDQIVAPETRDLASLARDLASWIAARIPGASDLRLENLDYPRGAGMSHETILFDAAWREGSEQKRQGMVVRIRPSSQTVFPDTLFVEQFKVMQALHAGGHVKVAKVLWLEEDPGLLGQPFFVMEKKHGRVPVSYPPYRQQGFLAEATPAQRRTLWENAVTELARMQLVPVSELRFLEGPPHAREGFAQEWDKYVRFVDWLKDSPAHGVLARALERLDAMRPANQPEGLVWGDARIGNMMFDDDFNVVAVMDWEQPSLGGALQDLSWFTVLSETMHGATADLPRLEGMGTRDETVALWEQVCGKSAADLEWYED
ncbi:MAG TPA: phosphotransferase family protein, partial [Novosphingobium sp.]|nr:phosphotransferase family protein [Novosphingobium sp.]